jgi:hypothetical protein
MYQILKKKLVQNLRNIPGWRTRRKIVVIESDDWGSIRMPSKEVYHALLKAGIPVDKCPYNKYDSLASEQDLVNLFEVLQSVKDQYGNPAVITANTIVANPDFEKIEASGFREYAYEPFTATLKRYPRHAGAFGLWKEGIASKVFYPQLHGREHLNIHLWMKVLQSGSKETKLAFDHRLFGISAAITTEKRGNFMPALDFDTETEKALKPAIIREAGALFEKIFAFPSRSFIAPSYTWSSDLESTLFHSGIRYLQGIPYQKEPQIGQAGYKKKLHYLGQKNKYGQVYLVRNCFFEPSLDNNKEATVAECLSRIKTAFAWGKPAIIGSHRLNYIGFIDEHNRDSNLELFRSLLTAIVKKWPDVEFMTSDQLGDLIVKN